MKIKLPKKWLVIIVAGILIAVAAGVGGYLYWKSKNTTAPVQTESISTEAEQAEEVKEPEVVKRAGAIEIYDPAKLAQAKDGKVIIWFCAKWSSTCKMMDKDLRAAVAKFPSNFTILTADYDKSGALKKQYQVPFENTYVQVDAGGAMINRWSGSETLEEIVALAK